MATAVVPYMSVEEYLRTPYSPDVDYVDGAIEERNLGEFDHADLQSELLVILRTHSTEWNIRAVVECRVQVAPTRFRVPDVCIMPASWKRTQIIRDAPLLCIEVLSPDDRKSRIFQRGKEFLAMGAREIWVFDPAKRVVHRMVGDTVTELREGTLALAGTSTAFELEALFAVLDK